MRALLGAVWLFLALTFGAQAQSLPQTAFPPLHRLQARGMHVYDLNHNAVMLRGYNVGSSSKTVPYTAQDLADIKASGLNVVRYTPQWYADPSASCSNGGAGSNAQAPAAGEYPDASDGYLPPLTLSSTATLTPGLATITVTGSVAGVGPGDFVSGSGIPAGDYVTKVAGSVLTLNVAPTGSGSQAVTFSGGTDANGYFSPIQLAILDTQVVGAANAGLWWILGSTNNSCDFYQNSDDSPNTVMRARFLKMIAFMTTRYLLQDFEAGYEWSTEPNPPNTADLTSNSFNNYLIGAMYRDAAGATRAIDPQGLLFVGGGKNYNPRVLPQIYQYISDLDNVVYMANFYELTGYVKQLKNNTAYTGLSGYPGTSNQYTDNRGDQPVVAVSYVDEGSSSGSNIPLMNLRFLVGETTPTVAPLGTTVQGMWDAGVTSFAFAHNVPVDADQVGVRTWTPGAWQYTSDILTAWNARRDYGTVGWQWWVYRQADGSHIEDLTNGGNSGDLCIMCQATTGPLVTQYPGNFFRKDTRYTCAARVWGAPYSATSTCDNWYDMIAAKGVQ